MIVSIVSMVVLLAVFYFLIRNEQVYRFNLMVIKKCYNYNINKLDETYSKETLKEEDFDELVKNDAWKVFHDKLPSYGRMIFDFKILRLESYFTKEEIKELTKYE